MPSWYVRLRDKDLGPISTEVLIHHRDNGEVTRNTLLHSGDQNWIRAYQVEGLFSTPPPEPTKVCPFCMAAVPFFAIKCKHCSDFLDGRQSQPQPQSEFQLPSISAVKQRRVAKWNPGIAAVLSLVIPGAGQMYKGQIFDGFVWLFLVPFTYGFGCGVNFLLGLIAGIVMHISCVVFASKGNPFR